MLPRMDNFGTIAVCLRQLFDQEVVAVVANKKQTGSAAAKAASKVLRDGRSGKASKTAAGSALSQAPKHSSKKK